MTPLSSACRERPSWRSAAAHRPLAACGCPSAGLDFCGRGTRPKLNGDAAMSSRSGAPQDHARNLGSTRREFLKRGATAVGGLALPGVLAHRAIASLASPRTNKSVIFVYLAG